MNNQKGLPDRQAGVIALAIPFLLLVILAAVIFILISQGIIKLPSKLSSSLAGKKEPTIDLQTQYQNPFNKSSGYVNPFSEYKNPFDQLK